MTDEEFLKSIPQAMHFAVYVCWVKEVGTQQLLADDGLIHELVHLLLEREKPADATRRLGEIRRIFNRDCELV